MVLYQSGSGGSVTQPVAHSSTGRGPTGASLGILTVTYTPVAYFFSSQYAALNSPHVIATKAGASV